MSAISSVWQDRITALASLPDADGALATLAQDITQLLNSNQQLQHNSAFFSFLSDANALIARAQDLPQLYQDICARATRIDTRIALAWIGRVTERSGEVEVMARSGRAIDYLQNIRITLDPNRPEGQGPTARSIRERRCIIVNRFASDPITAPWHEQAQRYGLAASISIPLFDLGHPIGALILYSSEADSFDDDLVNLLLGLGENISHAIDFIQQRVENTLVLEALRHREARYRLLAENVRDVIWVFDVDEQRFSFVSPSVEQLVGFTVAEILESPFDLILSAESKDRVLRWLEHYLASWQAGTYTPETLEIEHIHRDGHLVWVELSTAIHRDENSGHLYIHGVSRDVSERRESAQRLEQSKHNLQAIIDSADETIAMLDAEGRIMAVNTSGAKRLHSTPQSLVGTLVFDHLPLESAQARRTHIDTVLATGQTVEVQETREGRSYRTRIRLVAADTPRIVIYASDITDTLAREAARHKAEQRFRDIVELATEGIAMTDTKGCLVLANRRLHDMLGLVDGTLLGQNIMGYIDPADRLRFAERLSLVSNDPRMATHQARYGLRHADGHRVEILMSAAHLIDEQGNYGGSIGMLADITELIATERALRNALSVIEVSPVIRYRLLPLPQNTFQVDYVSTNISRWGYQVEEILAGHPNLADMIHPEDRERVFAEMEQYAASDAVDVVQEYRITPKDGASLWVEDRMHIGRDTAGRAIAFEGLIADITERKEASLKLEAALVEQRKLNKKLEEAHNQLLQSEKMASIGQLAAGVAHELNNPIGFVHSNLGTLENYLQDIFRITDAYALAEQESHGMSSAFDTVHMVKQEIDFDFLRSDIGQLLVESRDGLNRVKKIVQDLKDFSRVGEHQWQWADVHAGLDSTLNIVWNELKYKCEVIKDYAADLPQIRCLPSQLNQVVMNLLVNAAHAIPQHGTITIQTRHAGADAIQIVISDTGSGIPPENLKRIFDPFFTTKPVGQGTGLGLSIAYGIIGKHHGQIEVASELGKGTRFTLTLPIDPPQAEPTP